jgi:hypothetical protein
MQFSFFGILQINASAPFFQGRETIHALFERHPCLSKPLKKGTPATCNVKSVFFLEIYPRYLEMLRIKCISFCRRHMYFAYLSKYLGYIPEFLENAKFKLFLFA